ncbi:MAG: O-antigen ligase family protein [Gammaproteobacteria bacterium]|nr:O-antigen ligase family protein [Gammaproteobacteria bacterium]
MLTNIFNLYSSQEKFSEKLVFLILFLFPIAGPVIRHWNTFFFILIMIIALYFLITKKDRKPLYQEEKIFLWVFFLFFCVFIVSAVVNGWSYIQTRELDNESRFLLFIPIYLLIREYNFSKKAFFAGILLSIPVIFLFSLYEYIYNILYLPDKSLNGVYSQIFIGPIAALSLLMSYHAYKEWIKDQKKNQWLIFGYVAMGLFIIIFSQARLAYFTIIGGAVILLFIVTKSLQKKISGFALIILIVISSYQIDIVKNRTDLAIENVTNYFEQVDDINKIEMTSFGMRLEVWRSSQYSFKEHPFVGIGNGNYIEFIQKYIDQGLVSRHVVTMVQAHNTFIEAIISKGSIGFILLLMIFYYPMYIAWKYKHKSYLSFITIATFTTAITLMSTGDSSLINKNNNIAYLLFFTAVLFSSMIQKVKRTDK